MRIRVHQDFDEGEDYIAFFPSLGDCLLTLPLRGVPGIKKAHLVKESQVHYKEDGTPEIVVQGVDRLHGATHPVVADRIELGTYMLAPAFCGGEVELLGGRLDLVGAFVEKLRASSVSLIAA